MNEIIFYSPNKNPKIISKLLNKNNNLESEIINSQKFKPKIKSSSCSNILSTKDNQEYENLLFGKRIGKTTTSSEIVYLKNQKILKNYFKQNKNSLGLKLGYDKYYENIPIEKYVKEIDKYKKKKKLKKNSFYCPEEENKNIKNKMKLTPLPSKSRLLMNSEKEKNEFNSAERTAVMMRRFEYTSHFYHKVNKKMIEDKSNKERKDIYLIRKKAVEKIEIWWKNILMKKKKCLNYNDNYLKIKDKDHYNLIENNKISVFYYKFIKFYNLKIKFFKKSMFNYFIKQLKKIETKLDNFDINDNNTKNKNNIFDNDNNNLNNDKLKNNSLIILENKFKDNYNYNPNNYINNALIRNKNKKYNNCNEEISNKHYYSYSSINNYQSDNSKKIILSDNSLKNNNDYNRNNSNINYDDYQNDNLNRKNKDFLEDNLNKNYNNFQEYSSNRGNNNIYEDNSEKINYQKNNLNKKDNDYKDGIYKENNKNQKKNLINFDDYQEEEPNLNYLKIIPITNKMIKSKREITNNDNNNNKIEDSDNLKNNTFINNKNLISSYNKILSKNNDFNNEEEKINLLESNKSEKTFRKGTPNYDRRNKSTNIYENHDFKKKSEPKTNDNLIKYYNINNNNKISDERSYINSKSKLIALKKGNINKKKNDNLNKNLKIKGNKKMKTKGKKNVNISNDFSNIKYKNNILNGRNEDRKNHTNIIEKTRKIEGLLNNNKEINDNNTNNDNLKSKENLNLNLYNLTLNFDKKELKKKIDNNLLNNNNNEYNIKNNIINYNSNENEIQNNNFSNLQKQKKEIPYQEIIEKNKNENNLINQNNNNKNIEKINKAIKKEKINSENLKKIYKTSSKNNSKFNSEIHKNNYSSNSNQSSNLKSNSNEKDKIIKSENFWVKYYKSQNKINDDNKSSRNEREKNKKSKSNNKNSKISKINNIIEEKKEYLNEENNNFINKNTINNNNNDDDTIKEDLLYDESPQKMDILELTRRKLYNHCKKNNNINENKINKNSIHISQHKNDDDTIKESYDNNIDEYNLHNKSPNEILRDSLVKNNDNLRENKNIINLKDEFQNCIPNNEIVNTNYYNELRKNQKLNKLKISSSHISIIQKKNTITKEEKFKILVLSIENIFKSEFFSRMVLNYLSKNKVNLNDEELIALFKLGKNNTYQRILNKTLGLNIINSDYYNQNIPFKDWVKKFIQKKRNSTDESLKSKDLNNNNKNYKKTNI